MERKPVKAWAIARKSDNTLFDDGFDDDNGEMLVIFPIFRKKEHAKKYIKQVYGKYKFQNGLAKVIEVIIN